MSPGDSSSDLSYFNTTSLVVPYSTQIVDEPGMDVNISLPEVGSSLSVTGGEVWEREGPLVVDTSNIITYVTAVNEDGVYYAGDSIFLQVF